MHFGRRTEHVLCGMASQDAERERASMQYTRGEEVCFPQSGRTGRLDAFVREEQPEGRAMTFGLS
jgi:hypothetical protein